MQIFGRKLLDYGGRIELECDEIVFVQDGQEISISLYRARTEGRIEVRSNTGTLVVVPGAANLVEIETRSS